MQAEKVSIKTTGAIGATVIDTTCRDINEAQLEKVPASKRPLDALDAVLDAAAEPKKKKQKTDDAEEKKERQKNWSLDDELALLQLVKRHNFNFGQVKLSFHNDQHR